MPNRTVYLVDDEPAIIDPLAYALETDGFLVESFTLGRSLIERLQTQQPNCIVLDVGLPDITGFELFREVKQQGDIPILFLTARGDEIDRIVGLELGADDYVVKPFSPREVSARIRVILKRCQQTNHSAPVSKATLVLNRQQAFVSYCNQPVSLTKFEFLILAFLYERPNEVVSRTQLLDNLWPDRSGSMERSIDTHIKTLRAKLKKINDVDLIKTHRGLGYSLDQAKL